MDSSASKSKMSGIKRIRDLSQQIQQAGADSSGDGSVASGADGNKPAKRARVAESENTASDSNAEFGSG